jgi:hypothetical protein
MKTRAVLLGSLLVLLGPGIGPFASAQNAGSDSAQVKDTVTGNVYDVRKFGAIGDGKTLDHDAINKAIDAAAAAGGGTVYVGPGKYLCGSLHLKSNINLHLDMGAEIIGAPQEANAYDEIEPFSQGQVNGQPIAYQDGGHCYFHNSLIWGENLENVAITGLGRINGGGLVRSDGLLDRLSGFSNFGKANPSAPPKPDKPVRLGNKAIALKLCRNVTIKDVTIFHGGHFAILVTGCNGMTVDNVTMDTDRDGIDIDCCQNSMVSNCRINSPQDDGLCPKATFALGKQVPTENLVITNCIVSGWQEGTLLDGTMKPSRSHNGRIKLGTESSSGFRNITISNCVFRDCKGLALEEVDGAAMEDITINNLTMINVPDYAIYITTGRRNRTPGLTAPSRAKNILISNVVATGVGPMSGIQIMGLPDVPVEGVRIDGVRMESVGGGTKEQADRLAPELGPGYPEPSRVGVLPAYGVFARHAKDLELANIHVSYAKPDLRSALMCVDVKGLDIDNFKPEVEPGAIPAKFEAVTDDVIRNSPFLQKDGAIARKAEMTPVPTVVERPRQPRTKAPAADN